MALGRKNLSKVVLSALFMMQNNQFLETVRCCISPLALVGMRSSILCLLKMPCGSSSSSVSKGFPEEVATNGFPDAASGLFFGTRSTRGRNLGSLDVACAIAAALNRPRGQWVTNGSCYLRKILLSSMFTISLIFSPYAHNQRISIAMRNYRYAA